MRKIMPFSLLFFFALAGCAGNDETNFGSLTTPNQVLTPLTATLKGRVIFDGEPPVPKKIATSSDPGCHNPDLVSENVVVNDGGLANVILYVSSSTSGMTFPAPAEPVVIDQMGCHYIPHALTIQVGQTLKIVNSDNTAHNIHAWAETNDPFNISQVSKGVENTHVFTKPEMLIPIRCDVHNWMNAFIGVFDNPLNTVSAMDGTYEIKMPAGEFEITAEHEQFGQKTQKVTLGDGETVNLDFHFGPADKTGA